MTELKSIDVFLEELANAFPEIRDEVFDEDYNGLITLQVGCLKRFTQSAIDNNDLSTLKRTFDFVAANIDCVEFGIENSLVISYLGKLNFKHNQNAEKLLPVSLRDMIKMLDDYYSMPSKNEKINKFLKDLSRKYQ